MAATAPASARAPAALPSTSLAADEEPLEPVYVWDVVVRVCHWLIVISMLILIFTGLDISRPFLQAGSGKAGFTHGWVRIIHFYAAMAFSLAAGARVVWMFTGPRHSGWRQFIPVSRRRQRDLLGTMRFYLAMRSKPPDTIGHNPMAGLMYVGVFALFLLMTLTGFALYSVSSYTSYMHGWQFLLPWFHGPQGARWLHHMSMWILIIFAVNHVFSAVLTSIAEKNGCLDSIFSGFKFLPRNRKPDDDKD